MSADKNNQLGHLAILASAGSGKTTRLVHRYIQLLADPDLKLTPGRICALTFTRKAAGEIFDRVVECLCLGAADRAEAGRLAKQVGRPGLDQQACGRLLELFLDNLQRAVIGTMDSFISGVARAFPVELGVPANFTLADSDQAEGRAMRQEILADLLSARGGGGSGAGEFLEAFKKATFGVEEKGAEEILDKMMSTLHLSYRFCPDKERWGSIPLIWAGKAMPPTTIQAGKDLLEQAEAVRRWIEAKGKEGGIEARFLDKLRAINDALAAHSLTAPWSDQFDGTMFEQLLQKLGELKRGQASVTYYKKSVDIVSAAAEALAVLVANLVAVEIIRAVAKTAGLHALLEFYDRAYEKVTRETGRFSFTDIQYLLALGDVSRNVLPMSHNPGEGRLFIDYRMDASLDHWLLDEFQDTSDLQWAIFRNLVSELVQGDPDGRKRSFFYVGDVKQSIYRWRGGNPGLFRETRDYYNKAKEVIRQETMSETWRCSQPVVDAVNRVFSNLPADRLPVTTIANWQEAWSEHKTLNREAKGYAALIRHPAAAESGEARNDQLRYRAVADLLNMIQPARRGIGVGILTRENRTCSELVNVLRRECPGMSFVHEGKAGIVENELAQVLLSLIRLAAHPGDEFAWQHVRMSPLAGVLAGRRLDRAGISASLLFEIEEKGFRSFITEWGGRLDKVHKLNAYGRQCLARLEKAAAGFDATGSRGCNRFLGFIEDHEVHEEAARGTVRIMTIHQAKGLGFDMVILPELQHRNKMNMLKAEWTDREMLYGGKPFDPGWILRSPKAEIVANDPVLSARLREIDAMHCFDQLCMLYVAMTRARHALYMIISPAPEKEAFRPASLLKLQLAGNVDPERREPAEINGCPYDRLYSAESGDEKWYESLTTAPVPEREEGLPGRCPASFIKRGSRREVLERSEPSKQDVFDRAASDFFDPETRDVLDFGSAIHELFEKVEWLDDKTDAEAIIKAWAPSGPCDKKVYDDVCGQFRKCLAAPEVRKALARPAGGPDLWREKSFEIIMGGKWVSGVFDRVMITKDESGEPSGAEILDFKSNRYLETDAKIKSVARQYLPQMEDYRRALSVILGLPTGKISAALLFTVPAKVFRLERD